MKSLWFAAVITVAFYLLPLPCPAQQTELALGEVPTVSFGRGPSEEPLKPNFAPPASDPATRPQGMWAGNPSKFFQGAFVALLGHEAGHLITNAAMGTNLYLKGVHYGPIPFFTIEPGRRLNNHEHYKTASAGFTGQHLVNEWLLTKYPDLRAKNDPFLKGIATFNFWLTMGYAATAFAGTGPAERDTKGMADSLGWSEPWVGAMILVPTLLDRYRYDHPDSRWAVTASRLSKLFIIGLAARAH